MDLSTREGRKQQGDLIRRAARDAGMTAEDLAQRIGCSRSLIYQYISGASLIQTDRLQQIAAATGKPIEWFFRDNPDTAGEPDVAELELGRERARIEEERQRLAEERARIEERRVQDAESHLRTVIAAWASSPDWRRVSDACQQLVALLEPGDREEEVAELLLQQGNALIQLNEWGPARESFERAAALFRALSLPDRALACQQSLGQVNIMLGRAEEALRQFEQVANGAGWWNRWQGVLSVGAAHEFMGDYAKAAEMFGRAMEIADESEQEEDRAFAELYIQANWANVTLDTGDFTGAVERANTAVRLAQRYGVQDQYIEALLTRGTAQLYRHELVDAQSSLQQALDVAQLTRDHQRWSLALSCLSLWKTACMRQSEAIAYGKEALAIALRYGVTRAEIFAQRALAAAYLAASNGPESLYHAEQGLEQASASRLRLPQSQLAAAKGWALLATARHSEARDAGRAALKLADSLDAMPMQYDSHLLLSMAGAEAGDAREALHHASMASTFARTLGVRSLDWPAEYATARAHLTGGDRAAAAAAFERAVGLLAEQRAAFLGLLGEDSLLEDPRAASLVRAWLPFLSEERGEEAATTAAEELEWPPIADWWRETAGARKRKS